AVLGAEPGGLIDVRRRQHHVNAVGVNGQAFGGEGAAHNAADAAVRQGTSLGVVVRRRPGVVDRVQQMGITAVVVRRVDVVVGRASDALQEARDNGDG